MAARVATLALMFALTAPALADSDVRVSVPPEITGGGVTTLAAREAESKWVVIENVVFRNPSRKYTQSFELTDVRLSAPDGTVYTPKPRPGLGAIDLSNGLALGPRQTYRANVAFLVPASLERAAFAFVPKYWLDEYNIPVVYCCQ